MAGGSFGTFAGLKSMVVIMLDFMALFWDNEIPYPNNMQYIGMSQPFIPQTATGKRLYSHNARRDKTA